MTDGGIGRRTVLASAGIGLASAAVAAAPGAPGGPPPKPVDEGTATGGKVSFPQIHAESERPDPPLANPDPPARRVGFAIMGLGRLALGQIMPAFAQCKHAKPVALVSGDPEKMRAVAEQHGIRPEACYDYQSFDRIRDNAQVEAVYVVLPNALHKDAVIRAARAGKHVLCEKPMATGVAEGEAMVEACRRAGRLLMIAYRCQYEVNNVELARRARAGEFGRIQLIDAINTQNQGDPAQWRQVKALSGGGALPDVGLYCLNTARALLGEEPVEVTASIQTPDGDPRFAQVESNVAWTMRFPSGVLANCLTSYSLHEHRNMKVLGADATAEIENAFAYEGQRLSIMRRQGEAEANSQLSLGHKNQFALEIDHFAQCIRTGSRPRTPGEEGVQDQRVMAAIYESARTRRPVTLPRADGIDRFRGPMPPKEG